MTDDVPRGAGCFGRHDGRCHACQTCGDYTPCKESKERQKSERRRARR